jgi:hypothetical protein
MCCQSKNKVVHNISNQCARDLSQQQQQSFTPVEIYYLMKER